MRNLVITAVMLLCAASLSAQPRADYRIIPMPASVQTDTTQCFALAAGMGISYDASDPECSRIAGWLNQYVEDYTGIALALTPDSKKAAISLKIQQPKASGKKVAATPALPEEIANSSYTLTVDKKGIHITAACNEGLFRAMQTLRKSLPLQRADGQQVLFPYTTIADQPRFVYRGVHLDCARHFFSVETVKQYLDLMAMHGCNQFHWHITEDQGWRFEVKALPELARKGSVRKQTVLGRNSGVYDGKSYGGYYTQEQCREIVNYAAQRYINVIPEIDLPGHMQSVLHVYPNLGCTGGPYEVWQQWGVSEDVLCAGNPETLEFLKTVLGELCEVFPSKYIHIGGDECPKKRWRECEKCQAKARELGLAATPEHTVENQLQTYINREVEQFLAERGRDIIGWDETLEGGLTPKAIVMSWRGTQGGIAAARQHHRVIMSPGSHCYIDHYQQKDTWNAPLAIGGYLPVSKMYEYEPLPEELTSEEQSYILGPQANLWTEYVGYPEHVFYMLLPRLDAISEVQWTPADKKDLDDFKARLPHMLQIYRHMGVNYCHTIE